MDLNGAEIDSLIALVERGPLWDGNVPSKQGRDGLLARGLAVRILVQCADGCTAATYLARDEYKRRYGGYSMQEARANRLAAVTLRKAAAL